jgi:hypothetical protein
MKKHAGSGKPQGSLHLGTAPKPSPFHGGSGAPKGVVHAPRPPLHRNHGGTSLRQGVLNKKRK